MIIGRSIRTLVPAVFVLAMACNGSEDDTEKTGDTGEPPEETGDTGVATDDDDTPTDDDDDDPVTSGDTGTTPPAVDFTLQLLHFADVDSNEATALSNMDEFSALVDGLSTDATYGDVSMLVSSGDNIIPGPRWFAAENGGVRAISGSNEPGHADHYIMNALGVVATALGNHDLDQGPGEFADAIASETFDPNDKVKGDEVVFPGTQFPYLAANVDFSAEAEDITVGTEGAAANTLGGQVAKSATVDVDGETIGLVGVSTPDLPNITTVGGLVIDGALTPIADLAAAVQPTIDNLITSGVDKIVVLAHLQDIDNEKALATELEGVDIIVAGGSNRRMGDSNDTLYTGDASFDETYPFETTNADGDPLLIVNVDGDYKYLGRLVVGFDKNGVVIPSSIDDTVSGAYAAIDANVTASGGTANADVVAMRDALDTVIEAQYDNVVGHTDVYLEGRRGNVRSEETNLGNLTADANKWYAQNCDELGSVLSLKNGGGIRAEIGEVVVVGGKTTLLPPSNVGLPTAQEGDVSEGHFRGTLRFDNGLVVVDVTGAELKMLLEHGVARSGGSTLAGQFPQVGGISFGWDPTGTAQVNETKTVGTGDDKETVIIGIKTPGTRVTDLYVDTDGDFQVDTALYIDGKEQPAAKDVYTLVTLNFLANGGDSYPFVLLDNADRAQIYTNVGFGDPDVDDNDKPDFDVLTKCDPGLNTEFSNTGGEQDAIAEYMAELYPTPASPFNIAETAPADDRRIQNLSVVKDFVAPRLGDLIITGAVDGPLSGGTPKAMEIYVRNDVADLSDCGVGSANNGGGTDGQEYTFPKGDSAKAGEFIYVATEDANFNAFFGFDPDYTDGALSINGDDALELFCGGAVIDTFGDIEQDGTGQPWDHVDGWAYRVNGTGPDGAAFDLKAWTFSGPDALDGEKTNAKAKTAFPIGTYKP